jgi:GxxExxY protein
MTDEHEKHEKHETHNTSLGFRLPSPLDDETEALVTKVIGCGINVHTEVGPGFLEKIYKKAMCIELKAQGLSFETERPVTITYRGIKIHGQRIDLIVGGKVIVELKSVERLDRIHRNQLISYLKATGLHVGLLMNFRVAYLPQGLQRVVL